MGARQEILKLANSEWYEWTEGEDVLSKFSKLDPYLFEPLDGYAVKVKKLHHDKYQGSAFAVVDMRFKLELKEHSPDTKYFFQLKPLTFEADITFAFDENQTGKYGRIYRLIKKDLTGK